MQWHLKYKLEADGTQGELRSDTERQRFKKDVSLKFRSGQVNISESQFNRICSGMTRFSKIVTMLDALGYAQNSSYWAHAEWEFLAAMDDELVDVANYKARLDGARANLAKRYPDALARHLPMRPGRNSAAPVPPPVGSPADIAVDAEVTRPTRRTELSAEAVQRLCDPACTAWLRLLAQQCGQDGFETGRPPRAQVESLLMAFRALSAANRFAPLDAISKALKALHEEQGVLDTTACKKLQAAAHAVFALCLVDFVVAQPAARSPDGAVVLASVTRQLPAAMALLDDVLGHVTVFERATAGKRPSGMAVQVGVRDVITDRDDATGTWPGKDGNAKRLAVIARLSPLLLEPMDASGHTVADAADTVPYTDAQIREMLRIAAAQEGRWLRAALDLQRTDASAYLQQAHALATQIGLPTITYGQLISEPADQRHGAVHADLPPLEILIAAFLARLESLCVPKQT